MIKKFLTVIFFGIGMFLSLVVCSHPILDPFITLINEEIIFIFSLIALILFLVIFSNARNLLFYISTIFMVNSILSLILSRLWINLLPVKYFPFNTLSKNYGWGGDMAEDGLIIEMYLILLICICFIEIFFYKRIYVKLN
jgi:hypothetical protein